MKKLNSKLQLSLDALVVESFTTAGSTGRGTVYANETDAAAGCVTWDPAANSCRASFCDATCDCSGPPCDDNHETVNIAACPSAFYSYCNCGTETDPYNPWGFGNTTCS